jgi:hypothetical protein
MDRTLLDYRPMWAVAAASVDVLHAALMAVWLLGLPLLFWHRFPKLTFLYGVYAVLFVVITRVSHWVGGECFLTAISAKLWRAGASVSAESDEWFTVRLARFVFGMTPSHRAIAWTSEGLVLVTALGVLFSMGRRAGDRHGVDDGAPNSTVE